MITWSPRGDRRRHACVEYIAAESCDWETAWRWEDAVFAAVERLEEFPLSGRVVPEFGRRDIREVICGDYRIIYRVKRKQPEVISVRHGHFPIHSLRSL